MDLFPLEAAIKLVDYFTYLGSNISSTEYDVNISIGKACTALDRLSITRKSDLTDKIKCVCNIPQNSNYTAPCHPSHKLSK